MRDSRSRGASCAGRGSSTISTGPASFASSHARKTSATTETVKTMRILGAVYKARREAGALWCLGHDRQCRAAHRAARPRRPRDPERSYAVRCSCGTVVDGVCRARSGSGHVARDPRWRTFGCQRESRYQCARRPHERAVISLFRIREAAITDRCSDEWEINETEMEPTPTESLPITGHHVYVLLGPAVSAHRGDGVGVLRGVTHDRRIERRSVLGPRS